MQRDVSGDLNYRRKRGGVGLIENAGEIRGIGMLAAIECTEPGTKDPVGGRPMAFPAEISGRCFDKGLIARVLWENVALSPPLCTTQDEADQIADIVISAFDEAGAQGH